MVWFRKDIVTIDMMYSHYLKRLIQVNYDDVMKYIATGHGNKDVFENKRQKTQKVMLEKKL